MDDRLFGQFMEIASWGEPGPEALADPETGELPGEVIERLKWMGPPVIRFPGGTDVEFFDWTDRIDGVPGREGGRPVSKRDEHTVTNRFGYDEFLRLSEQLGSEELLVVNFRDAATGQRSLEEAAQHAAGLVAYCNAEVGAELPRDMPDWPAIRQVNGRAEPWGVRYWQIGNEVWFYLKQQAQEATRESDQTPAEWIADGLVAYADAMRAVDPDIVLIFDGTLGDEALSQTLFSDPRIKERIDLVTYHRYQPWHVDRVEIEGEEVTPEEAGLEALWYGWGALPTAVDERGRATGLGEKLRVARDLGYGVACTEWNWNGWGGGLERWPGEAATAQGLAAAAYLHGMMRQGEFVKLATQSMLLGANWRIAAIKADPTGDRPPFFQPSGLATGFYRRHHGDRRLETRITGPVPTVYQRIRLGNATPSPIVPLIDLVATRDDTTLYLHIIQRHFDRALPLRIDLTAFPSAEGQAMRRAMVPRTEARVAPRDAATLDEKGVTLNEGQLDLILPPRSASIIEIPLQQPYPRHPTPTLR